MEILRQLSIKSLKLNKKRTISTIIGIILSVALICAVASMRNKFSKDISRKCYKWIWVLSFRNF